MFEGRAIKMIPEIAKCPMQIDIYFKAIYLSILVCNKLYLTKSSDTILNGTESQAILFEGRKYFVRLIHSLTSIE